MAIYNILNVTYIVRGTNNMKKRSQSAKFHKLPVQPTPMGGLSVRTNLRAGTSWDDLDDQAAALWNQLTGAVSDATNALTGGGNSDTNAPGA